MSDRRRKRPRGAGERARPETNGSTAGSDAGGQDTERNGSAIAPSDFPQLVKRLDELRDADKSTPAETKGYLRRTIQSPSQELEEEVSRLRKVQPDVDSAIDALINGSNASYFARRPALLSMIADGLPPSKVQSTTPTPPNSNGESERVRPRKSCVEPLVEAARDHAELVHDRALRSYVTFERNGHRETWPIGSRACRAWLGGIAMHELSTHAKRQVLDGAIDILESIAIHGSHQIEVATRIAWHDGSVYVDLADELWRCIAITRNGWSIKPSADAPVRMLRSASMLPLPEPIRGGSLDELRPFVNVAVDEDFVRLRGWLIGAFLPPPGTLALLALAAERGSGKSTTARRLASIIDPRKAQLMSPPRELRDFDIAAATRHVVAIDNASSLPPLLSDRLCLVLSGGGFVARELYSNAEEVAMDLRATGIVTSIGDVVVRDDLSDRAVNVQCPPISPERRRGEREIEAEWRVAQPRILGALYDAVACALRRVDLVRLPLLPRLADFATFVEAAGPALGAEPGSFVASIERAQATADVGALADDVVGVSLLAYAERNPESVWSGDYSEFDHLLRGDGDAPRGWPTNPRGMSARLSRLAPALRRFGIAATVGEPTGHSRSRVWTVKVPARSSASPAPSAARVEHPPERKIGSCSKLR